MSGVRMSGRPVVLRDRRLVILCWLIMRLQIRCLLVTR
jgi:hypothetical protein